MAMISIVDKTLIKLCRLESDEMSMDRYFNFQNHTQQDGADGFGAQRLLSSIDAKTAPILAHVSIMIAGLIVLVSTLPLPSWKIAVLSLEIALYLLIAIGCLRCIHEAPMRASYDNPIDSREESHKQRLTDLKHEAFFKLHLFSRVNAFAIALTGLLLISTPLLIILRSY